MQTPNDQSNHAPQTTHDPNESMTDEDRQKTVANPSPGEVDPVPTPEETPEE